MSAMRCSYGLAFDDLGTINEIDQKRSILENGTLSLLSCKSLSRNRCTLPRDMHQSLIT
ncbi:UNVERIFIED_ORG: hypothetical protein GGE44_004815 [Rhizobium esperanzae]